MSVAEWLDNECGGVVRLCVAEWLDHVCGGMVRPCVWRSG